MNTDTSKNPYDRPMNDAIMLKEDIQSEKKSELSHVSLNKSSENSSNEKSTVTETRGHYYGYGRGSDISAFIGDLNLMNDNLRVFHSFWSKPLLQKRFGQTVEKQLVSTLLFTAIGVTAAKKLGIEIVLHTDIYGAALFECLPYDEVYLTLENHDINKQFWASGKMLALMEEPIGSCHLDLDAWIKYPKCRDIILNSKADIVFQSLEDGEDTYSEIKKLVFEKIGRPDFIDMDKANNYKAYNCGLVKINNTRLKEKWLDAYWKIIDKLEELNFPGNDDQCFTPDLIAEQWLVYQLCEQNGFSAETLCNGWGCPIASEIGFTHLISEQKYYIDDKLKNILMRLDERIYSRIVNKLNKILDT
jgi:hypothetical protein